jgi:hypothetical protein
MPFNAAPRPHNPADGGEIGVLKTLFETVPFPIAVVDDNGEFLFRNDAFERGWLDGNRTSKAFTDICTDKNDSDLFLGELRESAEQKTSGSLELRLTAAGGSCTLGARLFVTAWTQPAGPATDRGASF